MWKVRENPDSLNCVPGKQDFLEQAPCLAGESSVACCGLKAKSPFWLLIVPFQRKAQICVHYIPHVLY